MSKHVYSFEEEMYKRFVPPDSTDIVGKMAFSYYFVDKLRFIEEFVRDKGSYPTQRDFETFNLSVRDDKDRYMNEAADELGLFITAAVKKDREMEKKKKKGKLFNRW